MSVTAVPLHPLTKGTVPKLWIGILLVVLFGVGLAWVGTSAAQFTEVNDGIRYRVWDAGRGAPMTAADVANVDLDQIAQNGTKVSSTSEAGRPAQMFSDAVPAWMGPLLLQMREGGVYQLFVPVDVLAEGRPVPPGAPFRSGEMMQIRIQVRAIARGGVEALMQQQQQQLMQQQMMQQQLQEQSGRGRSGAGAGGAPALGGDEVVGPAPQPAPAAPRSRR